MPKNMQPRSRLIKRPGSPKFYAEIRVGDPRTKKRIRTVLSTNETVRSKAEAALLDLEADVLERLYSGEIQHSDKQPIGDYIEHYFATHGRALTSATENDYRPVLTKFVEWFDASCPLCALTRGNCEEWVYAANTPTQQHKRYRVIRAVLNEAIADGKLEKTPITFRAPKLPENVRDILSEEDFARFYEQMPDETPRQCDIKFMSYLDFATGLRAGEITHVKLADFDWTRKLIWIRNTEQHRIKNRREYAVTITPQVEDAYRLQLVNKNQNPNPLVRESPYLFANGNGQPYVDSDGKPRPVSKMFHAARKIVLPDRRGLHFHSLRHSLAQNAYDHGVPLRDITVQLNHSGEAITAKHYAQVRAYRRAETQYGSMEEYLSNCPILTRPEATTLEANEAAKREPLQGALAINEIVECSKASV